MKKQLVLAAVFSIVLFGFGSSNFALAIGEPIPGIDIVVCPSCNIKASDLGVDNVGTLPTSPFYFLKEWKRGITRLFTFGAIAKAELELNITNQIAAEVLEVAKTSSTVNYTGLERALQNYTDAQERLNFRITTINGTSNVVDSERLLKAVDEKTAKHTALLEQVSARVTFTRTGTCGALSTFCQQYEDLQSSVDNAQNNTLKTFEITVTPINDAPSLKQKAADQIESATVAIRESELNYKDVVFTADNWNAPQTVAVSNTDNDSAGVRVTVPKQTQGATFGEKAKTINGYEMTDAITATGVDDASADGNQVWDDTDIVHIFDRWGNSIAKAKEHLTEAKKAFAEGKYGEAYGLARSAEAVASGVRVAVGDINGDGRADKTAPVSPTVTPKPSKVVTPKVQPENRGANGSSPGAHLNGAISIEAETSTSTSDSTGPEKKETSKSSNDSAGPASDNDR